MSRERRVFNVEGPNASLECSLITGAKLCRLADSAGLRTTPSIDFKKFRYDALIGQIIEPLQGVGKLAGST